MSNQNQSNKKKKAKKSNNSVEAMPKIQYHAVSKDEHEILLDDLYGRNNPNSNFIDPNEKIFDFTSIADYNSIFKYNNRNQLRKQNGDLVNETKPLKGSEKYLNYAIIGIFYLFFFMLLPFSLIFCLKKVKDNERIVVYRLGRIKAPEYKPGFCILFPLIDSYQRFTTVQKEFGIPNLQILNHENGIVDTSTQIRYRMNDVIKISNNVQDLNHLIKSVARGVLVSLISKKDLNKIEIEKVYLKVEIKDALNEMVNKWGVEVTEVELTINGITKDESSEGQEDPALKTIASVFKSLFNSSSSSSSANEAGTSSKPKESQADMTANFLKFLSPFLAQNETVADSLIQTDTMSNLNQTESTAEGDQTSPFKLLKLIQPLINENLVNEIQTVYEFHIKITNQQVKDSNYKEEKVEVYFLDLKNVPKGQIGIGNSMFSKADCIIKTSDRDLHELLTDNLKPFTAYMSGRIEIDGDLQDVFKLKKLIKSVTSVINPNKANK